MFLYFLIPFVRCSNLGGMSGKTMTYDRPCKKNSYMFNDVTVYLLICSERGA